VTTLEQPAVRYTPAEGTRLLAGAAFTLPPLVLLLVGFGLSFRGGGVVPTHWQPVALGLGASLFVLAAVGAVPSVSPRAWLVLALWAALLIWTALSIFWSLSEEATFEAVTRVVLLAGIVAVGALYASRARAALVVAAGLAVTGTLTSGVVELRLLLGETELFTGGRLAWPMNYANADAALLWLSVPPLLAFAASQPLRPAARGAFGACTALAFLLGLSAESRGATIAVAAALFACVLIARDRARFVLTSLVLAIPIGVVAARVVGGDGELSPGGVRAQGIAALVAALLAGALVCALSLLDRRRRFPFDGRENRAAALGALAWVAVLLVAFVVVNGRPDTWVADRWDEFNETSPAPTAAANFGSGASNRSEYWRVAWDAARDEPVAGVGAGAFSVPWFRDRSLNENVTDAHSWQLAAFSELGIVGLLLTAAALLVPLVGIGPARHGHGAWPIAAVALGGTAVYFLVHASVDWLMRIPPVAIPGLLAIGVLAGGGRPGRLTLGDGRTRAAVAVVALAATLVVLPAYVATAALSRAESDAPTEPGKALDALETAERFNPFAVQPLIQRATILHFNGASQAAADAAGEAVERGPNDWTAWTVASDALYSVRDVAGGRAARRKALELNPRAQPFPW
jgi:peptidoglycan/LPS O-acetylase OafA/YrhL